MALVLDKFKLLLPKTKTSPSGWFSFNAPCCQHRGHSPDKRKRAGVRFSSGVVYHCFNCKFAASWEPGQPINEKFKNLCRWLGASPDDIKQLIFEALKTEASDYAPKLILELSNFEEKDLPKNSRPIYDWVNETNFADIAERLEPVIIYLINRGFDPLDKDFYWSPEVGYDDRVIIPFMYNKKIVGHTARKIKNTRPKYVSDQPSHFVFNTDAQDDLSKYILVVEGPFDALSLGGVALLTNDIASQQTRIINDFKKEVIVIPDQDLAGLQLIDRAIDNDWSVSFPNWGVDVKDCAEAVLKYGKLFTLVDIIKTSVKGKLKLEIAKKKLETTLKLRGERV